MKRFAIVVACTVMLAGSGCCGWGPYGGGGYGAGYGAGYAPTYGGAAGGCPGGNCGAYPGAYNGIPGSTAAMPYYGQSAYMPMGQTAYLPMNVNPVY